MKKKTIKAVKFAKFQPIRIKWLDSVHDSGWKRDKEFEGEGEIEYETVGLFSRETSRAVQVYQSRCLGSEEPDNHLVDAMMQIPKCAILSVKPLK